MFPLTTYGILALDSAQALDGEPAEGLGELRATQFYQFHTVGDVD